MKPDIRRIAINTGGGDAPGLNAVIRAVTYSALNRGWECIGIRDGYNGILSPKDYTNGNGIINLTRERVKGIAHLGGTILGTSNRGNPIAFPVLQPDGTWLEVDRSDELIAALRREKIDALVAIGGDGSLGIANVLAKKGMRVVGVPKTIDNDLNNTDVTFGFDTAVSFATECLDRLHSTAESHQRIIVVEVMGRYAGWIALHAGISGGAGIILIPEIPYDIKVVAEAIRERQRTGKQYFIVVVAEGAKPKDGDVSTIGKNVGQAVRLGGVGHRIAEQLQDMTGKESRVVVLGHLLRGGSPTAFDRLISIRFGSAAVRAIEEGQTGVMIALDEPHVRCVPLEDATSRMKTVPVESDTIHAARDLGISFGDDFLRFEDVMPEIGFEV